jgi:hypothetical protein
MFLVSEIEAESSECASEVRRTIDEECRVLDLLSLAKFARGQHSQLRRSRLKQP